MIRLMALCAAALLALAADTRADDITTELKTGGLVFSNGGALEVNEEDLFISMDEIRVNYTITNKTTSAVESVVTFNMPDQKGAFMEAYAINNPEADDFLAVAITENGKPVTPRLEQHVLANKLDRTADLRAAKVPLLPYAQKTQAAIKALPEDVKASLAGKGLLENEAMGNDAANYVPVWTLRSGYSWKTNFPVGKAVKFGLRYKPSLGTSLQILFMQQGKPAYKFKETSARYCMKEDFLKTAAELSKQDPVEGPAYLPGWITFDNGGGQTGLGPFARFRLTVDKGRPENHVSFCGDGIRQASPTTYVYERERGSPRGTVSVLFLIAPKKK